MDIDIDNSLNDIVNHNIDITTFIDNMNTLSLENQVDIEVIEDIEDIEDNFESTETYYDYNRNDTHTYVESNISLVPKLINDISLDTVDTYDTSPYMCFGIPNKYCYKYFDDEDFIFNRYDITNDNKKYIKINNSIGEYTSNFCISNGIIIDYNDSNDNPDIVYSKILYIYTYINYYYKDLKTLKPIERIKHLPDNLIYCVNNIVTIFKRIINDESLNTDTFLSIEDVYFKELCYGLKIITHELTLLLNHYKHYSLWNLEDKHIRTFFKIVNNMCVIIIFMKLNNKK